MDKYKKITFILLIFLGILGILTGQFILGGIMLLIAFGVHNVVGGGGFNDRNIYEKRVENCSSIDISDLFEMLRDMDTPLGKCWFAGYEGMEGQCIIFGPDMFKDHIAISKSGDTICLKSSTVLSHIKHSEEDAWRFETVVDTEDLDVTPKSYSGFASFKVVTAVMLDDLVSMIEKIAAGDRDAVQESLDVFTMYHYNSSDSVVRDSEDNEYAKCSAVYEPLSVIIYGNENEELASIKALGNSEKDGFAVTVSGESYGTLRKDMKSSHDEFYMDSPEGEIRVIGFRAVRKANLSCNYRVRINGVDKAVIAANAKLEFEGHGLVENNIICSYDDDFLVLYIALEDFILTNNRYVR